MTQPVYRQFPQGTYRETELGVRVGCDKLAAVLPTNIYLRCFLYAHCLILGFATEYSTSVRKFTATYVNPIARMQPCTR